MKLQYILNSISLADKQKSSLCKIIKKSGFLLLAVLFINSASTIETEDINNSPSLQYTLRADYHCLVEPGIEANCARYINLATAPTQRAFDYDPGMLPEVAEVIFALRIRHANAGKPYIINLSGNYLLKFTKDRIHILDTYTNNSDVYEYQSTDPNITLGLDISKGLPRHYKGIIIKEDAHGKLYDYAALRSDNISTDETMLNETLSHPFYEVAGQDGGEDEVTISKAMAFYHEVPSHSHSRHARCIKESMGLLEQIRHILGSGSLVCGPEAASDIRSANHQSAAEMKLDQPLVEAPVKTSKYPERLGYRLEKRWDLNGKNPVAVLAAANFCKVSVKTVLLGKRRQQRALDPNNCPDWVNPMVSLYNVLGLRPSDVNLIVEAVKVRGVIPAGYFPHGAYPRGTEGRRRRADLEKLIADHLDQAAEAIQIGAAISGEAAGASAFVECPEGSQSQAGGENATAGERLEIFVLNGRVFIPEPNRVKTVIKYSQRSSEIMVNENERYTTKIIYLGDLEYRDNINNTIFSYIMILDGWIKKIKAKIQNENPCRRNILRKSADIARNMSSSIFRSIREKNKNLVLSIVYYNNDLIGISTGRINGRTYHPKYDIASPDSLFGDDGSNRGQLDYLRSAVLRFLLLKGLIDKSELAVISKYSTGHDEPGHDEL